MSSRGTARKPKIRVAAGNERRRWNSTQALDTGTPTVGTNWAAATQSSPSVAPWICASSDRASGSSLSGSFVESDLKRICWAPLSP